MATSGEGNGVAASLHICMFPFLAFGHISPFAQLSRKLFSAAGVRITFLTAAGNVPRVAALLPSSPSISVVPLHLPPIPGLPAGAESTAEVSAAGAELLKLALDETKPQVSALLRDLRPDVVLIDFSHPWVGSITAPLGIKTLLFSVFAAVSTAFLMVPSRASSSLSSISSPPEGFPTSSAIKSIPTYQAADFSYVFKSFNGRPSVFDSLTACIENCDGVVIKTCLEMEKSYVEYIERQYNKKILLAGPLVPEPPPQAELEPRWRDWLGGFPHGSVVFSSFGSETFLTDEAAAELLLGLEESGQPFLVVLNFPKEGEQVDIRKRLPDGFLERVEGRGAVHSGWVQQQCILRHRAVGCFLCHAGFSSVVEGLLADCQLVMLPQKGDQYLNAKLFAAELGIGVEVERRGEDGWFGKAAVSKAVREVMVKEEEEGKREKHKKWREFFTDEEVQTKFTLEFVDSLKELATAE
ncbi:anthocyanidin-3-O-glucoside rhamnosyltransferase-like [Typha angustifolia]|uniref:anthocyanidin-3-O-glucoside rhamnosyltransferase-like n=1 Tax=Typha angustifolia TaxID=59011 RepID=UPI003C30073C